MRYLISISVSLILLFSTCKPSTYIAKASFDKSIRTDSTIFPDSTIEAFIIPYRKKLEAQMKRVIGYSKKDLTKNDGENLLGNFVADAIFLAAEKSYQGKLDMAAVNNGGLRVNLSKGTLTVNDMYELMPFENELVILELKGSKALKFFEFQCQQKKTSISHTKVIAQNGKPIEILINGAILDTNKLYSIAMSDYMASSEPAFLKEEKTINTGIKLRDLLIAHVEKLNAQKDSVTANIEGRFKTE
jgi:2',3'-cyclic-nucleotide 2'-phosphodiesterase (5'-nucleotidase family)